MSTTTPSDTVNAALAYAAATDADERARVLASFREFMKRVSVDVIVEGGVAL